MKKNKKNEAVQKEVPLSNEELNILRKSVASERLTEASYRITIIRTRQNFSDTSRKTSFLPLFAYCLLYA